MSEGRTRDARDYAGRPSVCRRCGALVGAGEGECMMCGAAASKPSVGAQSPAPPERERLHFIRAIVSRPATFTFIFLTACVFLYLLMEMSGGAFGAVLIQYGAKMNHLIDAGQWWRFVTPVFLHVTVPGLGPLHLLANMYGLFMLGPYVEKLYGSAKFVFFWVLTGVAGVAVSYLTVRPELAQGPWGSYLFKSVDATAAGASGALFGLVGVLFIFGLKYRRELPEDFKRAFGFGMLPMIVLNLFIGYVGREFVDNAAHLGGLLAGAVLALPVSYRRPGEPPRRMLPWRVVQAALLALVAACFVMAWLNFGGPAPDANRFSLRGLFSLSGPSSYVAAINEAGPAFDAALEGEVEAADRVIRKLDEAPPMDARDRQLRGELKALLLSAQQFGSARPEPRRKDRAQQRAQLEAAFGEWEERQREWIRTEGEKYHIILRESEPADTPGGETPSP